MREKPASESISSSFFFNSVVTCEKQQPLGGQQRTLRCRNGQGTPVLLADAPSGRYTLARARRVENNTCLFEFFGSFVVAHFQAFL